MILIPQRLFDAPNVRTILRDGNVCILSKSLTKALTKREAYVSNHVVSVLLAGEQIIESFEGEKIRIQAGEVLFIPRGMYYISDLLPKDGAFQSLLFYFDDTLIQDFLSQTNADEIIRKDAPTYLKFESAPSIQIFTKALLAIYQNTQMQRKQFLHLKILELLHLLHIQSESKTFANFLFQLTLPKKRNIKSFMEHNFDKPLKIEDYAYLTGRSTSTFRRDFKAYYSCTPQQWLKEKRLDKALDLINERERSITELSYEVGYENISYFIKAFKIRFGQSPKQYQLAKYRNVV